METCNSDTRNNLDNMLNIWQQAQIIDLSTYVTGQLTSLLGLVRSKFHVEQNFILWFKFTKSSKPYSTTHIVWWLMSVKPFNSWNSLCIYLDFSSPISIFKFENHFFQLIISHNGEFHRIQLLMFKNQQL
jgi:hypothetical protein